MTDFTCIFFLQKEDSTTTLYKTKCCYLTDEDKPFKGYESYVEDSILYIPYCPYYIKIDIPKKMAQNESIFASILNKRSNITCDFFSDTDLESICLKNISFHIHEDNPKKTETLSYEVKDGITNRIMKRSEIITFRLFLKMDILMHLKNVIEEDILKITENISDYSIEVSNF
jgi:hypothetical protein